MPTTALRLTSSVVAGPRPAHGAAAAHAARPPLLALPPPSSTAQAGRAVVGRRHAAPPPRAVPASDEEAPSRIESLTSETLEVALQARETPMVIDFYATWCGPCLLMAKELEKVAAELGDAVRIVKLDVDANPDIASQLRIEGLPTLVFVGMDPDKPALRTEGLLPSNVIKDIIRNELS